jgi:hypothetical protein
MSDGANRELDYYRAVEDLFATLRGVPHVLSPKDFHLLREWWRDEVPLSAVRAGITEAFARRRERGEVSPVVSLGYCRHAVREHAKQAADLQVGAPEGDTAVRPDTRTVLTNLADTLVDAARRNRSIHPRAADVVAGFATEVEAAVDMPAGVAEEHLFALESALLATCLETLDEATRGAIEAHARKEAESTAATPEARERTFRALRDRLLREKLDLPRLELGG